MSIATRIESIEEHIEQAYDELQGLGADLTNVNKNIENISMVLDDIYDSMPQVSGEGTSLTLDDTRVGKIKSTLKGNTSQSGTPTPTSPIPINVVSGDNEIVVSGTNMLDISQLQTQTISGITITNNGDGSITMNGTSTSSITLDVPITHIPLSANKTYTFAKKQAIGSSAYAISLRQQDKVNITNSSIDSDQVSVNITPTANISAYYMRIYVVDNRTLNNHTFFPLLKEASTVSESDYVKFNGLETYNIDLPESIELCKIGNYQDYIYKDSDKWYLHKEIGKVVLNGSENITQNYNQSMFRVPLDNFIHRIGSPSNLGKSNYYICRNYSDMYSGMVETGFELGDQGNNYIYIRNASIASVADFKTWLSTHNTEVYYVLATPVNTALEDM